MKKLEGLVNQTYQSEPDFEVALEVIDMQFNESSTQIIKESANIGQKLFEQKLGWIEKYRDDIPIYTQMVNWVHQAEKQLSHKGISQNLSTLFLAETETQTLTLRLENFKDCINNYLVA